MNHSRLGFLAPSGLFAGGVVIVSVVLFSILQGGLLFNPGPLNAQTGNPVGGVLSHAGIGGSCSSCHAPFWGPDRMTDRCLECHTDVSAQLSDPKTLHGIFKQNEISLACQDCHVEHNGPSAPLTVISSLSFPHDRFGFVLEGMHNRAECVACHVNHDYLNTPSDCFSCHAGKDIHNGQLGTDCARCHTPKDWKHSIFDHNTAIFKLEGIHATVSCASCHPGNRFSGTPVDCVACHAKDDVHTAQLGTDCGRCHIPEGWKPSTFDHNTAIFKLDGKHASVKCASCHPANQFKGTPTDCAACHTKDDVHTGQLGTVCSNCHTTAGWTPSTFDHNTIAFKLLGRHSAIACESCHISKAFKGTPSDCYSCHAKDDSHNGQLGSGCGRCHTSDGWKPSTFDHNTSNFVLTGRHASVSCANCHINNVFTGLPLTCYGCHAKDDHHNGTFGTDCSQCHLTSGWLPATFDHNLSGFGLTGAHVSLACSSCHANNVFSGLPTTCYGCHAKNDPHGGRFGTDCAQCHSTTAWQPASFNHNLSSFPLTGAHANLACTQCHVNNTFAGTPSFCAACHAEPAFHAGLFAGTPCDSCHNTSAWTPASYNGSHPGGCDGNCINHRNATCRDCHTVNLSTATCTKCHDNNNP
jgi:hypothetical protein